MFVFINDEFKPEENACLRVNDLSIQRGYGIFDFFRTRNNKPLFIEDHLERFYHSAEAMFLEPVPLIKDLKEIIAELIRKNNIPDSGIRVTVTGGYSTDNYTLSKPNIIIVQQPLQMPLEAIFNASIKIITHRFSRDMPQVKSINYSMGVWLQRKVKEAGANDVLYYDESSISEFPRANIFMITDDDCLVTPKRNVLLGITRKKVLEIAGNFCNRVEVRDCSLEELKNAKEIFLTSTTKRLMPVCKVDDKVIGNGRAGKVTLELNKAFIEMEEKYLMLI